MKKAFLAGLGLCLLVMSRPIQAAEPEYSASPSAKPRVTATPTKQPTVAPVALCQELRLMKGNGATAPETIEFLTVTSMESRVTGYRYHFGDGVIEEGGKKSEHRYITGGDYTAYVEVKDATQVWQTSETCRVMVNLKQPPLISGRVACGEVMITEGDGSAAPAEMGIRVNGKGPVEEIRQYRVDFGDGEIEESSEATFSHTYTSPGTYQIKGYVKDGMSVTYGGTEACVKTVKVLSATPLTTQPETGIPMGVWFGFTGMAITALVLRIWAYVDTHTV